MRILGALALLVLAGDVMAQPAPVPLGVIRRAPYVEPAREPAREPPPEPALPRTEDWRPAVRLDPLGRPRLRWAALPPGTIACSLTPDGRQFCGPGVWLPD